MSNYPIIVFEGIEASGKSTSLKKVIKYLKTNNINYLSFREPGGTNLSEKLRSLMLNKKSALSNKTDLFLLMASRSENIDKILKSNEKLKTDIIPIIESEKGIENLKEICEFKERIKVISFGSHDLAKSINLKVSDDENEILNYRKLIVSHSKDPIDTSYLNFKDLKGFERSCNVAKSIGFAGKACIHPEQVDISNKIF